MRISHLLVSGIAVLLISVGVRELAGGGTPIHGPAPVGNAVLKGIVKFEGTAPKAARINMSAMPECVMLQPSGGCSEDIVADFNGGVENVIVFVSDGLGDQTFDPPSQPMKI